MLSMAIASNSTHPPPPVSNRAVYGKARIWNSGTEGVRVVTDLWLPHPPSWHAMTAFPWVIYPPYHSIMGTARIVYSERGVSVQSDIRVFSLDPVPTTPFLPILGTARVDVGPSDFVWVTCRFRMLTPYEGYPLIPYIVVANGIPYIVVANGILVREDVLKEAVAAMQEAPLSGSACQVQIPYIVVAQGILVREDVLKEAVAAMQKAARAPLSGSACQVQ